MKIGELWQAGELTDVIGIPTSEKTRALAESYGLPLGDVVDHPVIDIAIDGADEVDPALDLIKGLGGALLREKMIELCAKRFIVVVDESKIVAKLGTRGAVPVEVTQFGWQHQANWLTDKLHCTPVLRGGDEPFVTDNGNYILDCTFDDGIADAGVVATQLKSRTGIVDHGLFLGMADEVIIASANGIQTKRR